MAVTPRRGFSRSTQRLLGQVALVGLVCVAGHLFGAFDHFDVWILGRVAERTDTLHREKAPLLVTLDTRTLDRWGPPPWSATRWDELAVALHAVGIGEAYLLEPASRVLSRGAGVTPKKAPLGSVPLKEAQQGAQEKRAVIKVPTVMVPSTSGDARMMPISLHKAVGVLLPWEAHLYLASRSDGVIRDLRRESDAGDRFGPSAFCDWLGACPTAGPMSIPLHTYRGRQKVPTISALDILDRQIKLSKGGGKNRLVFIGFSAPAVARMVRVGPAAEYLPFVEAVALAVTAAKGNGEIFVFEPALDVAVLLSALLLAIGIHRFRYFSIGPLSLMLLSVALVVLSVLLYALDVVRLPLTGLVLIGLIPPMVTLVSSQSLVRDFLQTVQRIILREGFRYTPRGGMIRSFEELHIKLGGLARNYAGSNHCATFKVDAQAQRIEFFKGYGLRREHLKLQGEDLRKGPWSRILTLQAGGLISDDVIIDEEQVGYLVPLYSETQIVGIWLIPFKRGDRPPNAGTIAKLVRWLAPRLALKSSGLAEPGLRLVNQMEEEVNNVRDLFAAASEERRQLLETFRSINSPLLVADVSGAVIYSNTALHQLMGAAGLGTIASIRELAFKLQGEKGLQETINRLFAQLETVRISWSDKAGHAYHVKVSPILAEGVDGQGDINGYIALFQDLSLPIKMKDVRASVVQYAASHIRDKLMAIVNYTGMIEERSREEGTRTLVSIIQKEARDIEKMTAKLRAVIGLDSGSRQVMPVNFVDVIYGAMNRLALVAKEKELKFICNVPEAPLPVMVPPGAAQEHFAMLLREACMRVPRSSSITINMEELEEKTTVDIHWPGTSYDEDLLHMLEEGSSEVLDGEVLWMDTDMDTLANLYRTPQEVFGSIHVSGSPGAGATISLGLPRA
ncbi:MAG: CHASE2 domain-containing protein [Deltaproteobacteria bacterium]|nr:CHASE2 domain-containing protein [Deltaproteobacteria bacterium]